MRILLALVLMVATVGVASASDTEPDVTRGPCAYTATPDNPAPVDGRPAEPVDISRAKRC